MRGPWRTAWRTGGCSAGSRPRSTPSTGSTGIRPGWWSSRAMPWPTSGWRTSSWPTAWSALTWPWCGGAWNETGAPLMRRLRCGETIRRRGPCGSVARRDSSRGRLRGRLGRRRWSGGLLLVGPGRLLRVLVADRRRVALIGGAHGQAALGNPVSLRDGARRRWWWWLGARRIDRIKAELLLHFVGAFLERLAAREERDGSKQQGDVTELHGICLSDRPVRSPASILG